MMRPVIVAGMMLGGEGTDDSTTVAFSKEARALLMGVEAHPLAPSRLNKPQEQGRYLRGPVFCSWCVVFLRGRVAALGRGSVRTSDRWASDV